MYCFPNGGVNSFGIVYNTKVFKDNGLEVPKSYEEFDAACAKLKDAGITPIYVSMADSWTVNQIMNAEWPNILSKNPDALEKLNKNEIRWDSLPEFTQMFERLKGYVDKGYLNSDMSTATYEMGQKALASGQAAMMYMGDWADPEYVKVEPAGEEISECLQHLQQMVTASLQLQVRADIISPISVRIRMQQKILSVLWLKTIIYFSI